MNERPEPLVNLAEQAMLEAFLDVERQIDQTKNTGPVMAALAIARDEAVLSLAALVLVDPEDAKQVRRLQNDVNRYTGLLGWILEVNKKGWEIERKIEDGERELTRQYLNPNPDKPAQEEDDDAEHDA